MSQSQALRACIRYLRGARHYLVYDQAIKAGLPPIATGVIVATWSRTGWRRRELAGRSRGPKRYSGCVRFARVATSTPTGNFTSTANMRDNIALATRQGIRRYPFRRSNRSFGA